MNNNTAKFNVLILAAGYGTRLYPLTSNLPKAFVSINDFLLIDIIYNKISQLIENNLVKDVFLISNAKFFDQFQNWRQQKEFFEIKIINNGSTNPKDRKGAISDLWLGIQQDLSSDWLIVASDNYFEDSLLPFVKKGQEYKHVLLAVATCRDSSRLAHFGTLLIDENNRVIAFKEKSQSPLSDKVSTCIYYLPSATLQYIPEFIQNNSTVDALGKYFEWIINKDEIYSWQLMGKWEDLGDIQALTNLNKELGEKCL